MEETNCDSSEAVLKSERWIRLGEIIHPTEYAKRFPKSAEMFNQIRNEKVVSWYGKYNQAYHTSLDIALNVLSERPGEFGRRIDFLVRSNPSEVNTILDAFEKVAIKISNKVLYELYAQFGKRNVKTNGRSIMVPGARKRTPLPELEALSGEVIESVQGTIIKALTTKFSELDSMGKVYLDEELRKIPMPTKHAFS